MLSGGFQTLGGPFLRESLNSVIAGRMASSASFTLVAETLVSGSWLLSALTCGFV